MNDHSYIFRSYRAQIEKRHDRHVHIIGLQKKKAIQRLYKAAHVDQYKFTSEK
tara:strand:- start:348 stop:506 length:159 start_codon:yes stop_codon:yes gene_type:complete